MYVYGDKAKTKKKEHTVNNSALYINIMYQYIT